MSTSIPSRCMVYSSRTAYMPNRKMIYGFIPVGGTKRIDLPSVFFERSRGTGNDLVHAVSEGFTLDSDQYTCPVGQWVVVDYNVYAGSTRCVLQKYEVTSQCLRIRHVSVDTRASSGGTRYTASLHYYRYAGVDPNRDRQYVDFYGYGGDFNYSDHKWSPGSGSDISELVQAKLKLALNSWTPKQYIRNHKFYDIPEVLQSLANAIDQVEILDTLWHPSRTQIRYSSSFSVTATLPSSSLEDSLLFDESSLIRHGFSMKPYAAYHVKAARQAAYLDALDHIPQLNENSVANILEIVSLIKSIVIDHRIEIPRSLQSAWLAYRYQYNTSKLDAQEAAAFVKRSFDLDALAKGFSCYGVHYFEYNDTPVVMRCRLSVKQKELDYLDKIVTALYKYGLSPSFYMIWDMIPYSFIVDWFIPVGDILSGYDKTRMYDRTYDISDIWFSLKYKTSDFRSYARWTEASLPEFQGYYTLENKGTTSNKVIGYRILDALSLLIR